MAVLTIYPEPTEEEKASADATPARWTRPIRKGEFDMVNMSMLGFDPLTGRAFDDVHAEWRAELDKHIEAGKTLRWWQLRRRWRYNQISYALRSHFGM